MSTKSNLQIDQGSDFVRTMTVVDNNNIPVNLTNYTFRGQMRKSYTANTSIDFTIVPISAATGTLSMSLSNANTSTLSINNYVYDVEIIDPYLRVYRVLEGTISINPNVSR